MNQEHTFWKYGRWIIDKISLCEQSIISFCGIKFCVGWNEITVVSLFLITETWLYMVNFKYCKNTAK
jgi:hypothetical protein